MSLRTVTYNLSFNTTDAQKGAKRMQITLKSMQQDAEKGRVEFEKLARTIGEKYGKQVDVAIDDTATFKANMRDMGREASRSEKAFEQLTREFDLLTKKVGVGVDEQQRLNAQFRLGAGATDAQRKAVDQMVAAYQRHRNAANQTQGSLRNLRGQMSNIGFQAQDIAVQMQMGTNAMVILGQQGSQLAAGFGPTGALVGAGIAFGAMIANVVSPSLFDAKDKTKELTEALVELAKATRISSEESEFLIRRENENIQSKQKQIETLEKQRKEIDENHKNHLIYINGLELMGDSEQARIARLKLVQEAETEYRDRVNRNVVAQQRLRAEIETSEDNIETYTVAVDKNIKQSDEWLESNKSIVDSLTGEAEALTTTTVELLKLEKSRTLSKLAAQNATEEELAAADAAFETKIFYAELSEESRRLAKERRDLAQSTREAANAEREAIASLRQYRKEQLAQSAIEAQVRQNAEDADKAEEERAKRKLQIASRLSDEGALNQLRARYEEERRIAADNYVLLAQLKAEYEENVTRISGSAWERYKLEAKDAIESTDEIMVQSLDRLTQGFGNFVETAIFDSENIGDAFKGMFEGAARSMVAFFAEYMAQKLIVAAFEGGTEQAAQTSMATAQSLQNEGMALQASLNAYAATSAIPVIGPTLAPGVAATTYGVAQGMAAGSTGLFFSSAAIPRTFDKGGLIAPNEGGIVSEIGDELVGGTMVYNGSQNSLRVTGREETARRTGGGSSIGSININSYGNASPDAIARSLVRALKRKNKNLDSELFESMNRGRTNKGKRFNA